MTKIYFNSWKLKTSWAKNHKPKNAGQIALEQQAGQFMQWEQPRQTFLYGWKKSKPKNILSLTTAFTLATKFTSKCEQLRSFKNVEERLETLLAKLKNSCTIITQNLIETNFPAPNGFKRTHKAKWKFLSGNHRQVIIIIDKVTCARLNKKNRKKSK